MNELIANRASLRPSIIALIIANVVPIIGVLFFDWSLFQIMFLYWLESIVIGFYNILKFIKMGWFLSIFYVPFFIVHYGMFMAVHLSFIFAFFAPELVFRSLFPPKETILMLISINAIPLITLIISHGISFFLNFIGKHEYENINIGEQVQAPYKRIILMHLTLLFGGWIIMLLKIPIFGLVLLVIFKTIADIHAHTKEHSSTNKKNKPVGAVVELQ